MIKKKEKFKVFGWLLLFFSAFGLKLFLLYLNYYHKHFVVPPGYDASVHYQNIKAILETGSVNFIGYPPGFYYLVIVFHWLTGLNIWSILTSGTPLLIILPSLAIFFLLRQLFSLKVSVLSTIVLLLSSNFPLYAFIDGNYPDMLAYGVFAVFLIAFLIRYYRTKKYANLIYAGIFLLAIAVTHHFTFFNILAILVIFGLIQLIVYLVQFRGRKNRNFLMILAIILVSSGLCLFLINFLYGQMFVNIVTDLLTGKSVVNNLFLNQTPIYPEYPGFSGGLIWYMGIFGFFYLLNAKFQDPTKTKARQLVIIWLLFFFLASRLSILGIPGRFARELALPLIVCIGFLFDYIEQISWPSRLGQIGAVGLIGFVILMNSALYTNLDQITDPFRRYMWFTQIDQEKTDYLSQNVPQSATILYNPHANLYFPVKTTNHLVALELTVEQKQIISQHLLYPQSARIAKQYQNLLLEVQKKYGRVDYIYSDVKPDSDTNETVYFPYKGFSEDKKILDDLAAQYQTIKSFDDGAVLYKNPNF